MRLMAFTCRILVLLTILMVWQVKAAQAHGGELHGAYPASHEISSQQPSSTSEIKADKPETTAVSVADQPEGKKKCTGGCCSNATCCSSAALPASYTVPIPPKSLPQLSSPNVSLPAGPLFSQFRPPRISA